MGIGVAWSNPCIETWFSAYLGKILTNGDSVGACSRFAEIYKRKSGVKYHKNDPRVYSLLTKYGSEEEAIKRSSIRFEEHMRNGYQKPTEMIPASTVYRLVEEIKN